MTTYNGVRSEYPRPQFERKEWLNLNGEWDFKYDKDNVGEKEQWYKQPTFDKKIIVPFSYETRASGIGEEKAYPYVWYHRQLEIPQEYKDKRVILHFQAADYITKLWVNGIFVGKHKGGYTAFSFDITEFVKKEGKNNFVVKIEDSQSCFQPRGKQRWRDESFGCWYVQTTGIWQTVWLEFLNEAFLHSVKITPDIDNETVEMKYNLGGDLANRANLTLKTEILFNGQQVKEFTLMADQANLGIKINLSSENYVWKVMHWSPQNPNLYDVRFTLYHEERVVDKVESYFGMRKISIENGNILLNNVPLYQRLLLDQGYWEDSHLTPPSEEAIIQDIKKALEMGFNGVRKHQKVEDQRFLYWADKLGLLVWSEAPATYEFSDEAVQNFTEEWVDIVKQHYNHPSIITWVPFNESWGVKNIFTESEQQEFTQAIYHITKSIDSMRPVIVNDGWEHTVSDILTLHDYVEYGEGFLEHFQDKEQIVSNKIAFNNHKHALAKGFQYKGQPILISEFGGIAFDTEKGWGYGEKVKDEEEFLHRYESLVKAIKATKYVCGFCYTQITDVQQEINGLLKENREPKVNLSKIKEINEK